MFSILNRIHVVFFAGYFLSRERYIAVHATISLFDTPGSQPLSHIYTYTSTRRYATEALPMANKQAIQGRGREFGGQDITRLFREPKRGKKDRGEVEEGREEGGCEIQGGLIFQKAGFAAAATTLASPIYRPRAAQSLNISPTNKERFFSYPYLPCLPTRIYLCFSRLGNLFSRTLYRQ